MVSAAAIFVGRARSWAGLKTHDRCYVDRRVQMADNQGTCVHLYVQ